MNIEMLENDGRQWFRLNGIEPDTNWDFDNDEYAIHSDGSILDSEGYPLTPGDLQEIAVSNSVKKFQFNFNKQLRMN